MKHKHKFTHWSRRVSSMVDMRMRSKCFYVQTVVHFAKFSNFQYPHLHGEMYLEAITGKTQEELIKTDPRLFELLGKRIWPSPLLIKQSHKEADRDAK